VVFSHRAAEGSPHFHTGIEFREMGAAERKVLEGFISAVLKKEASA
jgi:hypothetical protein